MESVLGSIPRGWWALWGGGAGEEGSTCRSYEVSSPKQQQAQLAWQGENESNLGVSWGSQWGTCFAVGGVNPSLQQGGS